MKRYKHNLSHYKLISLDMGELVPVAAVEVLPGDTFQHRTSALIRVTPSLKPLMHPVNCHVAHYYVPNRLLWSGWQDFITGESATPPPTISGQAYAEGTLQDYLGVPDNVNNDYLAFPVRAYNKIYNEFFRDQDLQSEVSQDSLTIQRVAWQKDYFTAARPWPQKGDAVTLPLGTTAPVRTDATLGNAFSITGTDGNQHEIDPTTGSSLIKIGTSAAAPLYADLSAGTALDVVDFREAFALQRYQEARAKYGSNYVDYLRYLGLRPSDSRLQRPEFLGSGRQVVSFSEVLNTMSAPGFDALGTLGGHGIAAMRGNRYRRFFEEHGWVISLMYVRPKSIYVSGLPRKFSRMTKEDYYQRELETVGAQEVLNREVYSGHSSPEGVFGYNDRYSEYRSEPSSVAAQFRNSTSYDWHFGRIFSSDQALNSTFVTCQPTKRTFADQVEDSLEAMVHHSLVARRMVRPAAHGSLM